MMTFRTRCGKCGNFIVIDEDDFKDFRDLDGLKKKVTCKCNGCGKYSTFIVRIKERAR